MIRLLLALAVAVLLAGASASTLYAQAAGTDPAIAAAPEDTTFDANWPPYKFQEAHKLPRGPGWYLALWKIALLFITFLVWVRTTDWVSRDCSGLGLNYDKWNSIVFFPFLITLLLVLLIPYFLAGFPLLLLSYAIPLGIYIHMRNALVPDGDKVLTKEHIRYLVANAGNVFGAKIEAEKKLAHEKGAAVNFQALGAENEQKNQANLIEARQSPAYVTLKEIVADAVAKRAEKVLFDYTADNVGMKYQIDGVWLDLPPRDRESTDPIAAVMKKLCNLKITDRKSKREGAFSAEYQGTKYMCPFVSQGTATGERAIVTLAGKAQKFNNLDELGMREKMRDQLKELLGTRQGIIVLSAMPQGGLSQSMAMALKGTDRLMRDFVAVGDKSKHEPDVENVVTTPYDMAAGETPVAHLRKMVLKQPDVLVVRELHDPDTLRIMIEQCTDEHPKLSITTIRAKEAVEALLRIAALKVPPSEFAPKLLCVLNTRLIRKLCDKCKEPFEPTAEFLTRLGIPAGRIQTLYRERQPLPPESKEKRLPCAQCNDIGYFGRTALFELLVMSDKLRDALVKQPQLEVLKKVAKATGHRGLQDEGIALLALGITSLAELQRVLKQQLAPVINIAMFTVILLFILFAVFAMLYLESFWSNSITLVNVTFAALLALNFFEVAADFLDNAAPSFTYLWDYLMLWALFCLFFGILRLMTDFASRTRVKFHAPIEIPGRLLSALGVGLVMVAFVITSFHVAPLPAAPLSGGFGKSPDDITFLFFSPDRTLLNLMQTTSRGSLSRGSIADQPVHPDDVSLNVNAFDPNAEFILKYRQRRRDLENESGLRVNRGS